MVNSSLLVPQKLALYFKIVASFIAFLVWFQRLCISSCKLKVIFLKEKRGLNQWWYNFVGKLVQWLILITRTDGLKNRRLKYDDGNDLIGHYKCVVCLFPFFITLQCKKKKLINERQRRYKITNSITSISTV